MRICAENDMEFWIENDAEIDEDIDDILLPDISLSEEDSQDRANVQATTRWIIALLTIF